MRETWILSLSWEDSPEEGNSYPLQYSDQENSIDCIIHGIAKSRTRLSSFHFHWGSNEISYVMAFCKLCAIQIKAWILLSSQVFICIGSFFYCYIVHFSFIWSISFHFIKSWISSIYVYFLSGNWALPLFFCSEIYFPSLIERQNHLNTGFVRSPTPAEQLTNKRNLNCQHSQHTDCKPVCIVIS